MLFLNKTNAQIISKQVLFLAKNKESEIYQKPNTILINFNQKLKRRSKNKDFSIVPTNF